MANITQQTKSVKKNQINRQWHLVDVKNKILGRIAGKIANLLQGKEKVDYVPYLDVGDYVVVINASKIKLTGKKAEEKVYTHYSGYPGGLKRIPFKKMLKNKPEEIIKRAVSGMLPKNKLRKKRLTRLFIFAEEKHPYSNKFSSQKNN